MHVCYCACTFDSKWKEWGKKKKKTRKGKIKERRKEEF